MKPLAKLKPSDLQTCRIWEFVNELESTLRDETYVRPVRDLPVDSLDNRIVGVPITLADGSQIQAVLQNIDLYNHYKTEHFITVTIFNRRGKRFYLARYHDFDVDERGPDACAKFLGKDVASVFPMTYDISDVATGVPASVSRSIPVKPRSPLSRDEILALAIG